MKMHTAVFVSSFVSLGTLLVALTNCGDDESKTEPIRGARKGEACQTTNDCADGLSCAPTGSGGTTVCVLSSFTVAQTAKECAITECTVATDCCGPPSTTCNNLLQQCAALQDAGASQPIATCVQYEQLCQCSRLECENNKCVTKCQTNSDCASSGRICAGGKCVQCASDDQCGSGGTLKCVSGECKGPCQGDGDCPGFQRCAGGQCTDGACQTSRECVAFTRNVEATCGTDGKCIVPCTNDLECGNPKNFRFYSCVGGQCLFLGCDTDKDCRLILEGLSGTSSSGASSGTTSSSGTSSGSFSPTRHIVCRDKQTPGNATIPAQ